MESGKFNRFKDLQWFSAISKHPILIGGAGGIGSWLTFLLTRAGANVIFVFDHDLIEEHNLGGQLFFNTAIGASKVNGLKEVCLKLSQARGLNILNQKYESNSDANPVMFSAFDNMQARRDMFTNWLNQPNPGIFIDGRLAAETFQIFCVTPDKAEEYDKTLFDDSEVDDAPCTAKQTSHMAAMIAAQMVGYYTNWVANKESGMDVRAVPFFSEYALALDYVNHEYKL